MICMEISIGTTLLVMLLVFIIRNIYKKWNTSKIKRHKNVADIEKIFRTKLKKTDFEKYQFYRPQINRILDAYEYRSCGFFEENSISTELLEAFIQWISNQK